MERPCSRTLPLGTLTHNLERRVDPQRKLSGALLDFYFATMGEFLHVKPATSPRLSFMVHFPNTQFYQEGHTIPQHIQGEQK